MSLDRLLFAFIIMVITSCTSKKDIYYFQNIENSIPEQDFKFLNIQPGDILDIQIRALNPESVRIFKRQDTETGLVQGRILDGYLVGDDHTIDIPIIGSVNTIDKTTKSLALEIQNKLSPFLVDPLVSVRILNFKISVLGEVSSPQTFTITEERITIPQALGMAGDLTINAERKNVLLIRNQNGNQISKIIDLTKSEYLQSDFYFLKQNDIIYVRPNTAAVKSSGILGDVTTLTSVITFTISLILLITR